MTTHEHQLWGCGPTPLAWYLKALGVLRVLGEQIDPTVRGCWQNETFLIHSALNRSQLEAFFLTAYQPTPLIAPWNGGSGFYPKDNRAGIDAIANSEAPRFLPYRKAISAGRAIVDGATERPEKEAKERMLQTCKRQWRGPLAAWFDAAVVLIGDGSAQYPALLGTGGNDGRLDFTNNFMQRLADVFDCANPTGAARPLSENSLRSALWAAASPILESNNAVGQFFPGAAGGANGTCGFTADSLSNAWDFILMLEGAVLFGASAVRRLDTQSPVQAAAPFAVRAGAVGYATATVSEEGARGEQWMPLWDQAATLKEVKHLIAEGRLVLPGSQTRRPTDVARAIARLGVSRGVYAFQRFGYIERNGQANLATPLGRWEVVFRPEVRLLDDVDGWVERARSALSDKPPARLRSALKKVDEAMMACTRHTSAPSLWQDLLIALGALESAFVTSPKLAADRDIRPLSRPGGHGLQPHWLTMANDNTTEFRLAVAFASQMDRRNRSVRGNFLPLDESGTRFDANDNTLRIGPDLVCRSDIFEKDAISLITRHLLGPSAHRSAATSTASSEDDEAAHFPLRGRRDFARLDDIAAFLAGETDDARILGLARALMALDWASVTGEAPFGERESVPAIYALLRIVHLPWKALKTRTSNEESGSLSVRLDPAICVRLAAGDLKGGLDIALRRLRASGLRPKVTTGAGAPEFARRLAASLAFPISQQSTRRLLQLITHPEKLERTELELEEESQCQ